MRERRYRCQYEADREASSDGGDPPPRSWRALPRLVALAIAVSAVPGRTSAAERSHLNAPIGIENVSA